MTCTLTRNPAPIRPDYAPVLGACDPGPLIGLCLVALVFTGAGIWQLLMDPLASDFGTFYMSGRAFWEGRPFYASAPVGNDPNLNPPSVVVALCAPVALLPLRWAAAAWTVAGMLGLAVSLRIIAGTRRLSARPLIAVTAGVLVLPGSLFAWNLGQVTWLLLVPVTLSWRAYVQDRPFAAGCWLAPLVACKPFFAVTALALGPVVTISAGVLSLAVSLFAFVVTGWPPWADWLALADSVRWLAEPVNASVPGMLARGLVNHPTDRMGLADVGVLGTLLWAGAGVVVIAAAWRVQDRDGRWVAAVLGAILVAPLGWLYYLPWGLPAFAARVIRTGVPAVAWMQVVPFAALGLVLSPPWLYALAGSWYTWGLIGLWGHALWSSRVSMDSPAASSGSLVRLP